MNNMILYTINGSGSNAVKAMAAYLEIPIEERARSKYGAELESINPSATVPTLNADQLIITETATILRYLASRFDPNLLGRTEIDRVQVDEIIGLMSTSIYCAYVQCFRPDKVVSDPLYYSNVKEMALRSIASNLDLWESKVLCTPFLLGDHPTIADFYAIVLLNWQQGLQPLGEDHPKLKAYWELVQQQEWLG